MSLSVALRRARRLPCCRGSLKPERRAFSESRTGLALFCVWSNVFVKRASVKTLPVSVAFHSREQLKWKEAEVETLNKGEFRVNRVWAVIFCSFYTSCTWNSDSKFNEQVVTWHVVTSCGSDRILTTGAHLWIRSCLSVSVYCLWTAEQSSYVKSVESEIWV